MPNNIEIYGADWCVDCRLVKEFLNNQNIKYKYVDITKNEKAIAFVKNVNNGKRVIPTLIVDNITYVNPGLKKLKKIIQ